MSVAEYVIKYDKLRGLYILYSVVKKGKRSFENFVAEGGKETIENIKQRMQGQ